MKTKMKLFGIMIATGCNFAFSTPIQAEEIRLNSAPRNSGDNARLIVNRSADFGLNESINLAIDGVQVAVLGINQSYDGTLPPGKHVVSITTNPKTYPGQSPYQTSLNAKPGKTYTFTAVWGDSERASLVEQ